MTWLTPMLAAIAAAIAIPTLIILYFLKLKRRDVEISSTLLWRKAVEDLQANAPFQRLRRNLLLFLQLLALIAGLLALASPVIRRELAGDERHVIVIDRSASMQTRDAGDRGDNSRLEQAKKEAKDLIEREIGEQNVFSGFGLSDRAMVMTFDTEATVLLPFTSDKSLLKSAIDSIVATDTPTEFARAAQIIEANAPVRQARDEATGQLLDGGRGRIGTVHIFSDGKVPDMAKATFAAEDTVVYHPVGKPDTANVGITGLRASRDYKDPDSLSLFVGIGGTYATDTRWQVEVTAEGNAIPPQIKVVDLPAATRSLVSSGGRAEEQTEPSAGGAIFKAEYSRATVMTVRVLPAGGTADPFIADDTAWVVVPEAKRLRVAVVTRGNFLVTDAVRALPLAICDILTPDAFTAKGAAASEYDVVVLDGWLPPTPEIVGEGKAPPALPPGRYIVFGAIPGGDSGLRDGGTAGDGEGNLSVVMTWSRDHPALRGIILDSMYMSNAHVIDADPASNARVLVTADIGPVMAEISGTAYRAIVTSFNPAASTWWQDPGWVVFMAGAMRYLGEFDSSGVARAVIPGQTITERIPDGPTQVTAVTPAGERTDYLVPPGREITVGPVLHRGVHLLEWTGAGGSGDRTADGRAYRPFAANLLSPSESDIAAAGAIVTANATVTGETASESKESPRDLWPWLILGVIAVLMLEWWVYNRKVYL